MTDSEIIKIMEICVNKTDVFVIHHNAETREYDRITLKDILGVINRLQAEKDDFKFLYENLKAEHIEIIKAIKHTKAEAYKEFAKRLKENSIATFSFKGVVMVEEIDDLLKELVGEDK